MSLKLHLKFTMAIIHRSGTYSQIHLQLVFAVKYRVALVHSTWKERLHQYTTALIQNEKHKMLQINCMPDHIHIFIGLRPYQSVSSLVQNVKRDSTKWINQHHLCCSRFAWQEGYGVFSYSKSHVPDVIRYIKNQEIHHSKENFLSEFSRMLIAFDIPFEENHIFTDPI